MSFKRLYPYRLYCGGAICCRFQDGPEVGDGLESLRHLAVCQDSRRSAACPRPSSPAGPPRLWKINDVSKALQYLLVRQCSRGIVSFDSEGVAGLGEGLCGGHAEFLTVSLPYPTKSLTGGLLRTFTAPLFKSLTRITFTKD